MCTNDPHGFVLGRSWGVVGSSYFLLAVVCMAVFVVSTFYVFIYKDDACLRPTL